MPILSTLQRASIAVYFLSSIPVILLSQQYPISTETPQILPAGGAHAEVGFRRYEGQTFPLSGLEGTLTKLGNLRPWVYRLANADAGAQTTFAGLSWKLLGELSFSPSNNSRGAEIAAGYDFAIIENITR